MPYVRYNDDGSIWGTSSDPFPGAELVEKNYVQGPDGQLYEEGAPQPVDEAIIVASMQAPYVSAVQTALDNFASTRGYDGIMSACSYAISNDATFRAEGERAALIRDLTWRKCYDILDEVKQGTRPVPTVEELLAMLPARTWEDTEEEEETPTVPDIDFPGGDTGGTPKPSGSDDGQVVDILPAKPRDVDLP